MSIYILVKNGAAMVEGMVVCTLTYHHLFVVGNNGENSHHIGSCYGLTVKIKFIFIIVGPWLEPAVIVILTVGSKFRYAHLLTKALAVKTDTMPTYLRTGGENVSPAVQLVAFAKTYSI